MRDSFVFYRSFISAIRRMKRKEDRLALYDAIADYALDDIAPGEDTPELIAALMETIMPQIDANNARYKNGKKGGRPPKDKEKPVVSESETIGFESGNHRLLSQKPNVDVNVDANDDVTADVTDNVTATDNGRGSSGVDNIYGVEDEFNIWKKLTPEDVDTIYDSYPNSGGDLIQAVYEDVKKKRKKVGNAVPYILGYADKVLWDDSADHGGVL